MPALPNEATRQPGQLVKERGENEQAASALDQEDGAKQHAERWLHGHGSEARRPPLDPLAVAEGGRVDGLAEDGAGVLTQAADGV